MLSDLHREEHLDYRISEVENALSALQSSGLSLRDLEEIHTKAQPLESLVLNPYLREAVIWFRGGRPNRKTVFHRDSLRTVNEAGSSTEYYCREDQERVHNKSSDPSPSESYSHKVFLCYAHEDLDRVLPVRNLLASSGIGTWIDKEDLIPGQNWREEIPKALRSSDFALMFFSNTSVDKRGYVQEEFKMVLDVMKSLPDGRIFTIPVKLEDCKIPDNFKHLQHVNLNEPKSFDRILRAIKEKPSN